MVELSSLTNTLKVHTEDISHPAQRAHSTWTNAFETGSMLLGTSSSQNMVVGERNTIQKQITSHQI